MSRVTPIDPTAIGQMLGQGTQFGLGIGMRAYQEEQDQAMQQRQMRLREMQYEREMADRREKGARVARSIEADSNIERALDGLESQLLNSGGVTPGPRPMGNGGMGAMGGMQGPMPQADMGVVGMGGAPGGMGPSPMLGGGSAGGMPSGGMGGSMGAMPVMPGMPTSILDVIHPDDYANASPGVKARVSAAMTNLVGELRKRALAKANVDYLLRTEVNGAPALRSIKPDLAEELFKAGALQSVPDEHFPVALLDQKHQQDMQEHAALLDHLTLGTAPGGVGPVQVDMAERERLGQLSTVDLRAERAIRARREEAQQKAAAGETDRKARLEWFDANAASDAAYQKAGPLMRASARNDFARDGVLPEWLAKEPKPMEDRVTATRAGNLVQDAEEDLKRAVARVKELANLDADPSGQTAHKGISAGTLSAARAEMMNAEQRLGQARRQRDQMLGGGANPSASGEAIIQEFRRAGSSDVSAMAKEMARRGVPREEAERLLAPMLGGR